MSVYSLEAAELAKQLEQLQTGITANTSTLDAYATQSNTKLTKTAYATLKAQYDSLAAQTTAQIADYNSKLSTYTAVSAQSEIYQDYQRAQHIGIELPNRKDKNQWYAGGDLRNETFAGGYAFTPTKLPSYNNMERPNDMAVGMLTGNVDSMLNTGLSAVLGIIAGGTLLDLMNTYMVYKTVVVHYKVKITASDGTVLGIKIGSFDVQADGDGQSGFDNSSISPANTSSMSPADVQTAMKSQFNAIGLIQNPSLVNVAITLSSLAFNKDITIETAVAAGMIGSVQGVISSMATQAVATALGVVSTLGVMAIGFAVGAVLGELAQMALGVDKSFGFGGEYAGVSPSTNKDSFDAPMGFMEGLANMLGLSTSAVDQMDAQGLRTGDVSYGHGLIGPALGVDVTSPSLQTSLNTSLTNSYFNPTVVNAINSYSGNSTFGGSSGFGQLGSTTGGFSPAPSLGLSMSSLGFSTGDHDFGGFSGGGGGGGASGAGNSSGAGFSCFTAGTTVKTPLGYKPIEDVKIGDILVGEDSSINKVLEYDCPLLGDRLVYSVNDSKPFVTAEHPIKTTKGWKSISPTATKADSEEVFKLLQFAEDDSTTLSVGDTLVTINGEECIKCITATTMSASTQLYNFKLDGNNTYYANGYLVHNK